MVLLWIFVFGNENNGVLGLGYISVSGMLRTLIANTVLLQHQRWEWKWWLKSLNQTGENSFAVIFLKQILHVKIVILEKEQHV